MAVKNYVLAVPLKSLASTSFGGTYTAINSTGLPQACWMICLTNNSDQDATISYDGTNDHEFIPKGTSREIYAQASMQPNGYIANFAKGLVVYVKGTAGMTGSIYLSAYFNPTNTVV